MPAKGKVIRSTGRRVPTGHPFALNPSPPCRLAHPKLVASMIIHFNRQPVDCPPASTLIGLLDLLGLSDRTGIAVACNDFVVPRPRWPKTQLQENDSITLIQATQGG